jgi:ribokinase
MSREQPRVCVVGSANVDLTFRAASLPRPGETLAGRSFQLAFGGKGANQAVAAARLGARVHLVARVGCDLFGEQLRQHFLAEHIDASHVRTDDSQSSGAASITVDDEGRNCILVVAGANGGLAPADVQAAAPTIAACQILLCQLEVPVETTRTALRVAREAGVTTVLNPAPAAPLADEVLRLADLCVPNETEAERLTGKPVTDLAEAEAAARMLQARGARTVVVTLGERGALLVDQGARHIQAVPVRAVDTTGAGDAFIGGLAVFLAEGLDLERAAGRACAVAALSVTRLGAQAALPSSAELEAFLAARRAVEVSP